MKAVILAGGKGTRLRPYTNVFPKPLMPVGDTPILEIVIRQLAAAGVKDIILAVGYLAELVTTFFGTGERFGVRLEYSREDSPLGTAGPLGLIRNKLDSTFLVMNGDVLSNLDFETFQKEHLRNHAVATIGLTKRQAIIDYGVVELNPTGDLTRWQEKPTLDYLVSMGIYLLEPASLEFIRPGVRLDIPDLMRKLIQNGKQVASYLHSGYWLDIGRPEDYELANKDIEKILPQDLLRRGSINRSGSCQ